MSQQHNSQDAASAPSTPTSTSNPAAGPSASSPHDTARLESDLLPSPTASASYSTATFGSSQLDHAYSNADGSARVYRFPNELPPRFSGDRPDPPPKQRTVTVRDLRTRSCWICSEEEEDAPSSSPADAQASSTSAGRRRRFVHPCNCTLVAHESCLLRWIEQSNRDHPLQTEVTCPQCKAPYVLINAKSPLLRLFESLDRLTTVAQPLLALGVVGGSVLLTNTTYSCVALRAFLGKDAARRALATPWPWHYWIELPLLPLALFFSRFDAFNSSWRWVPAMLAFHIDGIPMALAQASNCLFKNGIDFGIAGNRTYPPGPALTAVLIPWVRGFYLSLRRRVYRAVLRPFYSGTSSDLASSSAGRRIRRRLVVVGQTDSYLVDADPDLGVPNLPEGADGPTVELHVRRGGDGAAGGEGVSETVYVSHRSLGRMFFGALSMPFIANLMGRVLAHLARYSPMLARFLGIKGLHAGSSSSILRSFYTTSATPTKTSSDAAAPSPIAAIFRGRVPLFDSDPEDANRIAYRTRFGSLSYAQSYDDLDPVWFRNAVGAGVFAVVRDAAALLYKYQRLSQRNRTTIKDLPFQAGLVSGLDLRN